MILLSVDEIIEIHEKLLAATGGSYGIRDVRLLESAVMSCYQSFADENLYPTVTDKAARMAYAICSNHSFIDGNKRVAVTAMLVTLRLNDICLSFKQQELVDLGVGIADNSIGFDDIVLWIAAHTKE
jgi:death-on-curing protein